MFKIKKVTPKDMEKIRETDECMNAAYYLSGVYQLISVILLWLEEAEENLRTAGVFGFEFKQNFLACAKQLNSFEVRLRSSVEIWDEINMKFGALEPMLRKFVFDANTPELKSKQLLESIEDFIKRNTDDAIYK